MKVLRASDYKVMPWKNGGGETTEIAVSPDGAGLTDFDWRVSMAKVAGDGPFSAFPGIDRTLAILEGKGIVLSVDGEQPLRLTLDSEPHTFPADVATSATLIHGTVFDFNVMSRRGRTTHTVTRFSGHSTTCSGTCLVLCTEGQIEVASTSEKATLYKLDSALLSDGETAEIVASEDAQYYVATFRRA